MPVVGERLPEPLQLLAGVRRGVLPVQPLPLLRMRGQLEALASEHRDRTAVAVIVSPEVDGFPLVHNPADGQHSAERAGAEASRAGPADGLPVGELRERLDIPAATLTAHLNTLRAADLVHDRRDGRVIRVRANYARMNGLVDYLTENCCGGTTACGPTGCAPDKEYSA